MKRPNFKIKPQNIADPKVLAEIRARFETAPCIDVFANEIGVSRQTVYKHAKDMGLKRAVKPITIAEAVRRRKEEERAKADTSGIVPAALQARTVLEQAWRPQ